MPPLRQLVILPETFFKSFIFVNWISPARNTLTLGPYCPPATKSLTNYSVPDGGRSGFPVILGHNSSMDGSFYLANLYFSLSGVCSVFTWVPKEKIITVRKFTDLLNLEFICQLLVSGH